MIIDCHVHLAAMTAQHGCSSDRLLKTLPFRFMRWRLGLVGNDETTERQIEAKLVETLNGTPELDAAVVLAFDAAYTEDGQIDNARTHLHVTNDYVIEVCKRHKKCCSAPRSIRCERMPSQNLSDALPLARCC
jgi:hypothetical protein